MHDDTKFQLKFLAIGLPALAGMLLFGMIFYDAFLPRLGADAAMSISALLSAVVVASVAAVVFVFVEANRRGGINGVLDVLINLPGCLVKIIGIGLILLILATLVMVAVKIFKWAWA